MGCFWFRRDVLCFLLGLHVFMSDMLLGEKASYLRRCKSSCEAINVQQPVRLCMVATVLRRTEISEGVPRRRMMQTPVVCVRMGLARNKAGAAFHCVGVE